MTIRRLPWRVGLLLAALAAAAPARAFTAERYELQLRPEVTALTLFGQARIQLRAGPTAADFIDLPAPALQLLAVQVGDRPALAQRTADGWRIALSDAEASAATLTLDLQYRAGASEGLVFGDELVYTAFHSCRWMPCAGGDLSRAAVGIELQLPPNWASVSTRQGAAQPYALYTAGFAAGRFLALVDDADPRLRYLVRGDDEDTARAKFRDSARMLAFFEDKAGVPLPQPAYTQVLLPGAAAQEASSFSLIGHRMLDPIAADPKEDWVIAHELAHQWWGNLITCASWRELWLNEGLVTFMTAAWKQERWGEAEYQREMALARQRWQGARDAGFDRPLSAAADYPSLALRRAVQYSKGALFFDALRRELGEAAFWDGLRRYTRAQFGRSVTARDLQAAFEGAAARSLQPLFDAWVY